MEIHGFRRRPFSSLEPKRNISKYVFTRVPYTDALPKRRPVVPAVRTSLEELATADRMSDPNGWFTSLAFAMLQCVHRARVSSCLCCRSQLLLSTMIRWLFSRCFRTFSHLHRSSSLFEVQSLTHFKLVSGDAVTVHSRTL